MGETAGDSGPPAATRAPIERVLTLESLARSIEGRVIEAYLRPGPVRNTTLILGGIHGDEPKSVFVARRLIALLQADRRTAANVRWVIIPTVNPDGYERRKRRNARLVDINRNFPTANWEHGLPRSRMFGGDAPGSEPETQAVIKAVERYRPQRIIALHSISGGLHCNNYDGPGRAIAMQMKRRNGYPVRGSIGYPTPGSLGTWAGHERNIPTITLELPAHHSPKRCWEDNFGALLSCT